MSKEKTRKTSNNSSKRRQRYRNKKQTRLKQYAKILPKPLLIAIRKITEDEIVHDLSMNKAPGSDYIQMEMLNEAQEIILPHLKRIFNVCLQQQIILKNWNEAIIVILFKKGNRTICFLKHISFLPE